MAETDFKPLRQFTLYNGKFDANSLTIMSVKPSGSTVTRKVYYPTLKQNIAGYELTGTLTAGSTSITLSSAIEEIYNDQHTYAVGSRVSHTDDDEVTRSYICIKAITTAANWQTNAENFAEYTPINGSSIVDIYTKEGTNPYLPAALGITPSAVSFASNALTLTFTAQLSDVSVKAIVK